MDKLEAHLLHFDLSRGGFQEATVLVFRTEEGGVQIDPPLVSIRDFHRSMKPFYTDRFSSRESNGSSKPGDAPRQVLEGFLRELEGDLSEHWEDGNDEKPHRLEVIDRTKAQIDAQKAAGFYHDLLILGRFHRRREDFLGGGLGGADQVAFGFTPGGRADPMSREPNEDALGFHRAAGKEIFVVADAHHGSRSSELVVSKLLELFRLGFGIDGAMADEDIRQFLINTITRCHRSVLADITVQRSRSSLVAAVREGAKLHWASVSDAFLYQGNGGQVHQLNRDLGYGITGRKLSIWLGDKRFIKILLTADLRSSVPVSFC